MGYTDIIILGLGSLLPMMVLFKKSLEKGADPILRSVTLIWMNILINIFIHVARHGATMVEKFFYHKLYLSIGMALGIYLIIPIVLFYTLYRIYSISV